MARLDVPLVGVDFSPTQLAQARAYLDGLDGIELVLASGTDLPFVDGGFDMVLTSAVILHNPPAAAEQIRCEVIRVARRFAAHNEDTDISYNRYGYDTAAWYRAAGITLAESGPIPTEAATVAVPVLRGDAVAALIRPVAHRSCCGHGLGAAERRDGSSATASS